MQFYCFYGIYPTIVPLLLAMSLYANIWNEYDKNTIVFKNVLTGNFSDGTMDYKSDQRYLLCAAFT